VDRPRRDLLEPLGAPETPGFLERLAHGYYSPGPDGQPVARPPDLEPTLEHGPALRRTKLRTLALSALAGALGVLLLHAPRHWFPDVFRWWTVAVPLGAYGFDLPLFSTLYGLTLAVAEIYCLVLLNIRAVHGMARTCGFPSGQDPDRDLHVRSLVNISVEKDARSELRLGLNPWQGYSRTRIAIIFAWNRVKATLSNVVVKMLLRRILGRYAVRLFIDLAGMPVMAAWNAYAAGKVIDDARVRILAPGLIQGSVTYFHRKYADREAFSGLLYDALQYLAVLKRAFHENHYLLSVSLLKAFEVPLRGAHEVSDDFVARLSGLDGDLREDVARLIIIGMIIDGRLSWQERRAIRRLIEAGVISQPLEDIRRVTDSFTRGQGATSVLRQLKMGP